MKAGFTPSFWTTTEKGRKALIMFHESGKSSMSYYLDDREVGTVRMTDAEVVDLVERLVMEAADAQS